MDLKNLTTLSVRVAHPICYIKFNREKSSNAINQTLISEFHKTLDYCEDKVTIIVIEGSPAAFCVGMDFKDMIENIIASDSIPDDAAPLFTLWQRLAEGPFITISHLEGKVNAGGIGFVSASDIVISRPDVTFSLSEMLFGLIPACVLPFLNQRVGEKRSAYMAMTTWPLGAKKMYEWGLVDHIDAQSNRALGKHLSRVSKISKTAIIQLKTISKQLRSDNYEDHISFATNLNRAVFSNKDNLENIRRYVDHGLLPWEK
ncbi:MAG: enoyl-CoA hydratase/isomerase [Agarilytica sp.]